MSEEEVKCGKCKDVIDGWETRHVCDQCKFVMCENCLFAEKVHIEGHHLKEVAGIGTEMVYLEFKDKKSGNTLFLGDYHTALPGSTTLTNNSIKSVLTIMELDQSNKEKAPLCRVFKFGKSYSKIMQYQGVLYHHINLPDIANPNLIDGYSGVDPGFSLPHLFGEATSFIDNSMKRGNTLVHCEKGQYRSPSMVIAWLITCGFNTTDAINLINDFIENNHWGEMYRKNRPLWVEKLQLFETKWPVIKSYWRKKNKTFIQKWARPEINIDDVDEDELLTNVLQTNKEKKDKTKVPPKKHKKSEKESPKDLDRKHMTSKSGTLLDEDPQTPTLDKSKKHMTSKKSGTLLDEDPQTPTLDKPKKHMTSKSGTLLDEDPQTPSIDNPSLPTSTPLLEDIQETSKDKKVKQVSLEKWVGKRKRQSLNETNEDSKFLGKTKKPKVT